MAAFTIKAFLVHHLKISNKEALSLIASGKIMINEIPATPTARVSRQDEVIANGKVLQEKKKLVYIKFYKPRGIESTLSKKIPGNLTTVFTYPEKLFPVGRLDQQSEGLMIFTNDGAYYKRTADKEANVEKEYVVTVNKPITPVFLQQMSGGVTIMGKTTRPAKLFRESDFVFRIILTEGLNRQIRRMCYKLGYEVDRLVRVRIGDVELGNLKKGQWKAIH